MKKLIQLLSVLILFSCNNQSKKEEKMPNSPEPGCGVCYQYPQNSLDIGPEFMSTLEFKEKIGEDSLKVCSKCGAKWLGNSQVSDEDLKFKQSWETQKETIIPQNIQDTINSIGASLNWDYEEKKQLVPCKLHLKNGETIEFGAIMYSKSPPISYINNYKTIDINEVESISSSKYALSLEARLLAREASEAAMSFAPTVFKNKKGEKVVTNGPALFFKTDQAIGSELVPANERWSREKAKNEKFIYQNPSHPEETLVIIKTKA